MSDEQITRAQWVKLELGNDWGSRYWMVPGPTTCSRRRQEVRFSDKVKVRWPDGSQSVERVEGVTFTQQVFDHGHTSEASSTVPHLVLDAPTHHRGVDLAPRHVRLDAVEVWMLSTTGAGAG